MVCPILRIVFHRENQSTVSVGAVSNLVDQQANSVVVVSGLQFGCIHAVHRGTEVAKVVVREANQFEGRKAMRCDLLVELALPLFESEEIREIVVVSPEAEIGSCDQGRMRRKGDLDRRIDRTWIDDVGTDSSGRT